MYWRSLTYFGEHQGRSSTGNALLESEMTDQFEGDLLRPHGHPAHASRTARPRRGTQCRLIFLASDASSYATCITLPVDGGILAT